MKIFLIIFFILSTSSIFAKNISDCSKLIDDEERLACYDSLTKDNISSDVIIIPTLEKLVNEKKLFYKAGNNLYGCVYGFNFNNKDLLTGKRIVKNIIIGNSEIYAKLWVDEFKGLFLGDKELPKIGDCYAFTLVNEMTPSNSGNSPYYGTVVLFKGEYKVDNIFKELQLEDELTVSEYFDKGLAYGSEKIKLTGEVSSINSDYASVLIDLTDNQGRTVSVVFWFNLLNQESILKKVRLIKIGDTITVEGNFTIENNTFWVMFDASRIIEN